MMRAQYIGSKSNIFSISHGPERSEMVAIIAPGFPWEMQRLSWTIKRLAETLEEKGIETISFHYLSTGDSKGKSEDFNIDLAKETLKQVIDTQAKTRSVILIGFSLGANLVNELEASNVKARFSIDPVLEGVSYLKKLKNMHQEYLEEKPFEPPYDNKENRKISS